MRWMVSNSRAHVSSSPVCKEQKCEAAVGRVNIWCQQHEAIESMCFLSTVQTAAAVRKRGSFFTHFGTLKLINHGLNVTVYLGTVTDHVHPFMATVPHLLRVTSSRTMFHVPR